jgi:hypothetical protein
MKRINHEEAYSLDGACTNWAEEFFSRSAALRSATITISPGHLEIAGRLERHGGGLVSLI